MSEPMSFRDHVRKRPGMYLGETGDGSAANHVVFELVANTLDQHLAGKASHIDITVDGHDISITDDGPGLPIDQASAFVEPHQTANRTGHAPHVHIASHGVGLAVVAAASRTLAVTSRNGATLWRRSFKDGIPSGGLTETASSDKRGTDIRLTLEHALLAPCDLPELSSRLRTLAALYPAFRIQLNGEAFHKPGGLGDCAGVIMQSIYPGETCLPLWHRDAHPKFRLDLALAGPGLPRQTTRSWCNGVETRNGGSHVVALNAALGETYGWGSSAVALIHVVMEEPKFAGPTKDELDRPELVDPIKECVLGALRSARANSGIEPK